jgi:hypothetical protein
LRAVQLVRDHEGYGEVTLESVIVKLRFTLGILDCAGIDKMWNETKRIIKERRGGVFLDEWRLWSSM